MIIIVWVMFVYVYDSLIKIDQFVILFCGMCVLMQIGSFYYLFVGISEVKVENVGGFVR